MQWKSITAVYSNRQIPIFRVEQRWMLVWFWRKFGATLYATILTIFTISNSVVKTPRDNLLFLIYKELCYAGLFVIFKHLGHCNTEITSNIYVHIFKEYKAKMAESIEHDLLWSKRAVQFVKNWAVLFTFHHFYGIIQLIDKLEFVQLFK